ncbi:MAG: fatty acid desaturase [Proteobacteria bacterium]|nr:fatty acid desaturase [Pseudomonadota bacterium]
MSQLDHRAFLKSLSAEQRRQLLQKSDWPGLLHLTVHFGAILICSALLLSDSPFYLMLLPVQGFLIIFLFTALHETIHGTAFRTNWLNTVVAHISGFLILIPPTWFHDFHFAHHRFTHDPDKDPELQSHKPSSLPQYLVYISGISTWREKLTKLISNALGRNLDSFVSSKNRMRVVIEARVILCLYLFLFGVSLATSSLALLWIWVLPALLGQPMLRLYLLAEHTGCSPSEDMFVKTRTTYTNPVLTFFAWNMPYHAEHHAFAAVPFHKLPDFHQLTQPHLKVTETGYLNFNRKLVQSFQK